MKKTTVASVDTDGGQEELNIAMPSGNTAKVRILFTSSGSIQNLKADFNASNIRQFSGANYTLLELDHPSADQIHVSFRGQRGKRGRVEAITEYDLTSKAVVT